jgi:hypothetical protein
MDILSRFASTGDRSLLPGLAEYFGKGEYEVDPELAVRAALQLSNAVSRKKASIAWNCLWRLSDSNTNSEAWQFLQKFQSYSASETILERCVTSIANASDGQPVACFKFLAAFMRQSAHRRQMVSDTPELSQCLIDRAHEEIQQAPIHESIHAIDAVSNLVPITKVSIDENDLQRVYYTEFINNRGLQVLAVAFQTAIKDPRRLEGEYSRAVYKCVGVIRSMWAYLTEEWPGVICQANPQVRRYTRDEVISIAQSLADLLCHSLQRNQSLVQSAAFHFLEFVEVHEGEGTLALCLDVPSLGSGNKYTLLMLLTGSMALHGNSTLWNRIPKTFARWRANNAQIAVLLDRHCPTLDAIAHRNGEVAPAAVGTVMNAPVHTTAPSQATIALTRTKAVKDRHCAYPDCAVSGMGTEYTWKCARCFAAYYCSRDHQKRHWWAAHKAECKTAI